LDWAAGSLKDNALSGDGIIKITGRSNMKSVCPGQDFRNLRVELYKCPKCGAEEEIFSNETKAKCHQCGEWIYKEQLPSCIDWCASARECLGEDRWKNLTGCE
jgi:DNA-directed RNA polymerase subunit RPC12/RpoP